MGDPRIEIRHHLVPHLQTWFIPVGTYATRLHGGPRATVDRDHNTPGESFITRDDRREQFERNRMRGEPVYFTMEQCEFIESIIPAICERGGWTLRVCSASPPPVDGDHVHVLLDAAKSAEPKKIRELYKRWLTQELDKRWPRPRSSSWWAEGGSTKPVDDESYLNNTFNYVDRQRASGSVIGATSPSEPARPRAD